MRLRLPKSCQPDCALCASLRFDARNPPLDDLRARLEHAERTGQRRVYVQGRDVAGPYLAALVSVRPRTLRLALVEEGPGLALPAAARSLREMGIANVYLSLAVAPDEGAGSAEARKPALAVLLALSRGEDLGVGVHVPLDSQAVREIAAALRLQSRLGLRELLISDPPAEAGARDSLPAAAALAALDRAWLSAHALGVRLQLTGFERLRYLQPAAGEPAPACDAGLLDMLRNGVPLPSAAAGIRALGRTERPSRPDQVAGSVVEFRALGLELAARRLPFVDVPPCLGGVQSLQADAPAPSSATFLKADACGTCPLDARCPGASTQLDVWPPTPLRSALRPLPSWPAPGRTPRVLVLSSLGGDPLFYISTLPALADALKRRGVSAELVSPWASRWQPDRLPPLDRHATQSDWMSTADVEAWVSTHDLAEFDVVIASDFPTARVVLETGSLRQDARVSVTDFHMLETMDRTLAMWLAPGARAADGGWWPSEQLVLESAFPGYVPLYRNYGIPLEQIVWRPYSLCRGHFPAGMDVLQGGVIFSGGNHLRDLETLRAATERLPAAVHPVDLYAPGDRFEGNAHLRHRGQVGIADFCRELASSRFLILTLREDITRAAGQTVLGMALAAGRPVVASATASMADYIQHGVEGLLVPPGDPQALANAIAELDTNPELLAKLAEGARDAGRRMSTDYWAEQIAGRVAAVPRWTPSGWRNW